MVLYKTRVHVYLYFIPQSEGWLGCIIISCSWTLFLIAVVCFDAKINFDDNARFRQKEIFAQEDTAESDPREVEATRHSLNYVGMDGNIGCMGEREGWEIIGGRLVQPNNHMWLNIH